MMQVATGANSCVRCLLHHGRAWSPPPESHSCGIREFTDSAWAEEALFVSEWRCRGVVRGVLDHGIIRAHGSTLTKYRSDLKSRLEDDFKEGGQRSATQVLACSLLATLIAVYHASRYPVDLSVDFKADVLRSGLLCAFVGHYACCNGDTWASELGVLSPESPRLITSFLRREVPRGTNGGISIVGTLASVAGGATIGAVFTLLGWALGAEATSGGRLPWWLYMTGLGAVCGFVGSMVDSLLGAVLQATWYCPERKHIVKTPALSELRDGAVQLVCGRDILTNEQVNVLSVLITTMLAPWIGSLLW